MDVRLLLLPIVVLCLARSAHAAESFSDAADAPPPAQQRNWYGWQTALTDVASLGLGATASGLSGNGSSGREAANVVSALALTTFVLGGPTVHAAHQQWGKAGASLALRLGAPTVGAVGGFLVGNAACPHDDRDLPCSAVGAAFGLIAGAVSATILDAAVIAYEPAQPATGSVHVAPLIVAQGDRWQAGLRGTF